MAAMKLNPLFFAITMIALFGFAVTAAAGGHPKTCQQLGKMYLAAASLRDQGADRDMLFSQLRIMGDQLPGYVIDDEQVFNIAERVYYSAEFADKGGEPLGKEIERQCANGQIVDVFVKK